MSINKKTFKKNQGDDTPQPTSFWRKLFGGKPVKRERVSRKPEGGKTADAAPARAEAVRQDTRSLVRAQTATLPAIAPAAAMMPGDVPRNPKSFLAKKFNSQIVKEALLDAIGKAIDGPPALDPIGLKFWVEGLARKGLVVEGLDCGPLTPEQHLRAIQWMASVEKLDPRKATYREDLYVWKFKLAWILDKDIQVPDAVIKGGLALRKFYQVVRQKTESLAAEGTNEAAMAELEAYDLVMETIENLDVAKLDPQVWPRLANTYLRADPYNFQLTVRHARFKQNIETLVAEIRSFDPPPAEKAPWET